MYLVSDPYGFLAKGNETFLRDWVRLMHPEALGPLVGTLLKEPKEVDIESTGTVVNYNKTAVLAMQQIAVANILRWLAADPEKTVVHRLVEEAFARTEPGESSEYKEGRLLDFKVTKEKVERFLDKKADIFESDPTLFRDRNSTLKNSQYNLDSITAPLYDHVCVQENEFKMKVADHKRSKMKAWGAY